EDRGDPVDEALDQGLLRLRLLRHRRDLRQLGVGADGLGADRDLPVGRERTAEARSPAATGTGTGSPVRLLVSSSAVPSTIVPSTGTVSPGRTRTTSPGRTDSMGVSTKAPFSPRTRAVFGARSLSAASRSPALRRDRVSKYRPASWNVVTPAATS